MKEESVVKDEPVTADAHARSVEVRVPASTSNLGSGFDCCGLALQLYLTVRATVGTDSSEPCRVRTRGEGASASLPRSKKNLIYRAMRLVAEGESLSLPPVRLAARNEIPLASGLGSSGAAIIAGIALGAALGGRELPTETVLRYATQLEGHADNVAAALLGGWVVHCIKPDGGVLAVKRPWPSDLKVTVISPHFLLETRRARAVLPDNVKRADAVYNMQRVALFNAAIEEHDYDLLWEAMQDRLHQTCRQVLVPGLAEALTIPRRSGLLGVALSGAGPSVLALALDDDVEIGNVIAESFRRHGIEATVRRLAVDEEGIRVRAKVKGTYGYKSFSVFQWPTAYVRPR
ncbi:MAG: homoserine kinase [Pyrinomonadaceae bacterium]